jgi:ABC-type Mn2+/Zn2+ transport system ATPase subunit
VSGGERKRVTTGEVLVTNARFIAADEISTGLDSATLYSIIMFLKQGVGALRSTMLVSLLQPPPEVLGLFDDIIVMDEGCAACGRARARGSRWHTAHAMLAGASLPVASRMTRPTPGPCTWRCCTHPQGQAA